VVDISQLPPAFQVIAKRKAREPGPLRGPAEADVQAEGRYGLRLALTECRAESVRAVQADDFLEALVNAAQGPPAFHPPVNGETGRVEPSPPFDGPKWAGAKEVVAGPPLTKHNLRLGIEKRLGESNAEAPLDIRVMAGGKVAAPVGEIDDIEIEAAAQGCQSPRIEFGKRGAAFSRQEAIHGGELP